MECQDPEIIKAGFIIDRDLQGIKDLALSLTDPDTGEVVRKKKDYSTCQGVCGQPLTESLPCLAMPCFATSDCGDLPLTGLLKISKQLPELSVLSC